MKNPYEQHFQKARLAKATSKSGKNIKNSGAFNRTQSPMNNTRKKRTLAKTPILIAAFGLIASAWGYVNSESLEGWLKKIEIGFLGNAVAEEKKESPAASAETSATAKENESAKVETANKSTQAEAEGIDHLSKLNERKVDLDNKEQELGRIEEELQKQREEIEAKLKELNSVRDKISAILDDRVKADEQKVENLVQMYSTMKPPQAAKIFEALDEDLAVEVLGRMKKKNAAEIMNLLKPEKAQVFSERYAGYKRR